VFLRRIHLRSADARETLGGPVKPGHGDIVLL
jgi:hypothetical protein